jgi:hypothetical protein
VFAAKSGAAQRREDSPVVQHSPEANSETQQAKSSEAADSLSWVRRFLFPAPPSCEAVQTLFALNKIRRHDSRCPSGHASLFDGVEEWKHRAAVVRLPHSDKRLLKTWLARD